MTEYWVSKPKHHCQYCNCWIQGDKVSIRHHESGVRHKNATQMFFKKKNDQKTNKEFEDRELKKQLAQIEEEARNRYAMDIQGRNTIVPASKAPPPPPLRNFFAKQQEIKNEQSSASFTPFVPPIVHHRRIDPEMDERGIYTVRGKTYLDGKLHEDILLSGCACQYWSESNEEWLTAKIVSSSEIQSNESKESSRHYYVTFQDPKSQKEIREETESENLRLLVPDEMTADLFIERRKLHVSIDENTGYGQWSTVSVREYDDEAERLALIEKEKEEDIKQENKHMKEESFFLDDDVADDASSAYNPWGGKYKGVELTEPDFEPREKKLKEYNNSTIPLISFRTKKSNVNKNTRKIRRIEITEDEDDDDDSDD